MDRASIGSAGIAQAGGNPVDRQLDPAQHPLVAVGRAMPPQQLDLQVVQRIEIRQPMRSERASSGLPSSSARWPMIASSASREACHSARIRWNTASRSGVRHQRGVARGNRQAALGQHHVHVRQQRPEERPLACIARSTDKPSPGCAASHVLTAVPKPYQPGSISRHCAQLNTHGIARRASMLRVCVREAGRLPMFSVAISPITVDSEIALEAAVSYTRLR